MATLEPILSVLIIKVNLYDKAHLGPYLSLWIMQVSWLTSFTCTKWVN